MKLTDKKAIKALKKVRCYRLERTIDDLPENEVDGRTDWEIIANEAGWLLDAYNSLGCARCEDLEEAKYVIYRSRRGLPNDIGQPYTEWQIQDAKDRISEYNRLDKFVKKLKGMGLYCPYC